ncbi:MAG: HAD family phosphatase [Oscillospiraceae bacterium]|nr:HAD family phosphatase [Oscillospiraceae bacterium]
MQNPVSVRTEVEKKLLIFDLDGTLLTTDKIISGRTLAALGKARAAGYLLGFSTSRGMSNIEKYTDIVRPDVIIASSGALVTAGEQGHLQELVVCR